MQTQTQTMALPLTTSQLSVRFITSVVCGKFLVHTRCASTAGRQALPDTRYSRAVAYTLQKRQNKYTHRSTQIYSSTSGSHHRQRAPANALNTDCFDVEFDGAMYMYTAVSSSLSAARLPDGAPKSIAALINASAC